MNQKPLLVKSVSFADGEIMRYIRELPFVTVFVKLWDERQIKLEFIEALSVRDLMPGDISDFVEIAGQTELVLAAQRGAYEHPPEGDTSRHFAFIGLDGQPSLEIVAESYRAIL